MLESVSNQISFVFRIVAKLEEKSPDQVEGKSTFTNVLYNVTDLSHFLVFKSNCNVVMKDILGRFKDLQFFTGESMDCDGMIAMLEYRDIDGVSTPILMVRFPHWTQEIQTNFHVYFSASNTDLRKRNSKIVNGGPKETWQMLPFTTNLLSSPFL